LPGFAGGGPDLAGFGFGSAKNPDIVAILTYFMVMWNSLRWPVGLIGAAASGPCVNAMSERRSHPLAELSDNTIPCLYLQSKGLFQLVKQRLRLVCVVTLALEPGHEPKLRGYALLTFRNVPLGKLEVFARCGSIDEGDHNILKLPTRAKVPFWRRNCALDALRSPCDLSGWDVQRRFMCQWRGFALTPVLKFRIGRRGLKLTSIWGGCRRVPRP
jgi:hypothetical protein